ncbi:MAG: hypothetical protein Q7W02_14515 [Candidatus Rokubacteria bacterium]|nr:hypothetical protein [Candidatus Rokubacteria bacterium]
MSEALLEQYLVARRALDVAAGRAAETVERVRRVATMLGGDWRDVAVLAGKSYVPLRLLHSPAITRDEWPSIDEIADVLGEWHRAYDAVVRAWAALPEDRRREVTSPGIP